MCHLASGQWKIFTWCSHLKRCHLRMWRTDKGGHVCRPSGTPHSLPWRGIGSRLPGSRCWDKPQTDKALMDREVRNWWKCTTDGPIPLVMMEAAKVPTWVWAAGLERVAWGDALKCGLSIGLSRGSGLQVAVEVPAKRWRAWLCTSLSLSTTSSCKGFLISHGNRNQSV